VWSATSYLEEKSIYAIARDITEAKKIDQMKSEFISTISHELRTPLTSIRGSLGMLAKGVSGELPGQASQLIDIAHRNCERLVHLINDFLDSEKIASGKMNFTTEPVELNSLVRQAVEANQPYASQHGVKIIIGQSAPRFFVSADPFRLTQVLDNLLSNAAKFSPPESHVTVTVSRVNQRARVAVSDLGPGIPAEFKQRIFERFAQADTSDARQKGGTGLGLSIAKAIIVALGGEIDFTSDRAHGTTFYFELPELQNSDQIGTEATGGT